MGIGFFKLPKHRVFNYQPRYYDPVKDDLQERLKQYGKDPEAEKEIYRPGQNIRGNIRRNIYEGRRGSKYPLLGKIIILACILLLMIMVYFFAKSVGLFFR